MLQFPTMRIFTAILLTLHFAGVEMILETIQNHGPLHETSKQGSSAMVDPLCPDEQPGQPCTDDCGLCLCHPALFARREIALSKRLFTLPQRERLPKSADLPAWLLNAAVYRPPKTV